MLQEILDLVCSEAIVSDILIQVPSTKNMGARASISSPSAPLFEVFPKAYQTSQRVVDSMLVTMIWYVKVEHDNARATKTHHKTSPILTMGMIDHK